MLHRIKKHNDINEGKWIGVGGHAEGQESPEECLLREVKEETGLDVKDAEGGYMFTYKRENPGEGDNYFVDVYRFTLDVDDSDVTFRKQRLTAICLLQQMRSKHLHREGIFLHYDSIKKVFE